MIRAAGICNCIRQYLERSKGWLLDLWLKTLAGDRNSPGRNAGFFLFLSSSGKSVRLDILTPKTQSLAGSALDRELFIDGPLRVRFPRFL